MCSGFLVIDVFPLLLCVFLLDGSVSVVVGLSPCTALLEYSYTSTPPLGLSWLILLLTLPLPLLLLSDG